MSFLVHSKVGRLVSCLISGDFASLQHQACLMLGVRGLVPRPVALISQYVKEDVVQHPLYLLVVSHNLEREGASISLQELICGLKVRYGISSEVIAFGDGPLRKDYEAHGIAVEVLPSILHRISTAKRLEQEVKRLASRIKASPATAVFVNTLLNFPAVLAAEEAGLPSVWNPRESEPWNSYFRFLPDPIAQQAIAAIGLPQKVVFVAETTRKVWQDFESATDFMVIHNALNTHRFSEHISSDKKMTRHQMGWREQEVVFLCVGTLCERKGQLDALLAIKTIAAQLSTPVRLVFVGELKGRYAKELQDVTSQLKRWGTQIRIDFMASTMAIGNYYLAADVFMLCSRVESYPRVILEALAFGLPIISTPVFGVAEQIPDPEDAYFYEPGDIPQLANHFLTLANDSGQRSRLAARSKIRFSRLHTFEQMLDAYAAVVREV